MQFLLIIDFIPANYRDVSNTVYVNIALLYPEKQNKIKCNNKCTVKFIENMIIASSKDVGSN